MSLTNDVAGTLQTQAHAKRIDLNVVAVPQSITVRVDRDRITQVLTNIVGNAVTYTDSGGTVTVTASIDGQSAMIEVKDTGRGLTPEQQSVVFERFYRADRSGPGGSGIGLTIAQAIARRHGGTITATSPGPGKGSAFTLTLPTNHHQNPPPIPTAN
jgi:signal transduction histidine kinase